MFVLMEFSKSLSKTDVLGRFGRLVQHPYAPGYILSLWWSGEEAESRDSGVRDVCLPWPTLNRFYGNWYLLLCLEGGQLKGKARLFSGDGDTEKQREGKKAHICLQIFTSYLQRQPKISGWRAFLFLLSPILPPANCWKVVLVL